MRTRTDLTHARPLLKEIAPLTAAICRGFAWVNFVLSAIFFFILPHYRLVAPLLAVNSVLTYQVWGVVFLILGITHAGYLRSNGWNELRKTLFIGVLIKVFWLITLLLRVTYTPSAIFLATLWGFLAYIQASTYVNFLPKAHEDGTE
jgi:uncharacterized membrane protein HdeD (DUF308 family)